jgi:hypothetical protein
MPYQDTLQDQAVPSANSDTSCLELRMLLCSLKTFQMLLVIFVILFILYSDANVDELFLLLCRHHYSCLRWQSHNSQTPFGHVATAESSA